MSEEMEQRRDYEENPFLKIARERSRQIGIILAKARKEAKRSLTDCAQVINTSRQRYRKLKAGEADITVVELEAVCTFLNLLPGYVLTTPLLNTISPILLQTEQGQTLRVVVQLVN